MSETNLTVKLNLENLLCPIPVVKLSSAIKKANVGDIIEATATDPGVMMDIPAWCQSTGNEMIKLEEQDKIYTFIVKKIN